MAQDHSVFSNIQDNRTSSLAEQVADQINQVRSCPTSLSWLPA